MLLKCKYLAQFSVNELAKNSINIASAEAKCPFLSFARSSIHTGTMENKACSQSDCQKRKTEKMEESDSKILKLKQIDLVEQESNSNKILNAVKNFNNMNGSVKIDSEKRKLMNKEEIKGAVCTNSIECPFFKQGSVYKSVTEKNFDDLTEKDFKKPSQHLDDRQENKLFDYEEYFLNKIESKKKDGSYRYFKKITRHAKPFPIVQETNESNEKQQVTIWCSNDYLGLGRHSYVQSKVIEAVNNYGVGSGGTRNISGSTPLHYKLEDELAKLHKKESALLFTSCYVANDTTLYTLAKMLPNCHILSDSGNHASMIQGIRNSGIPKTIFKHNDYEHLESILKNMPINIPKIVAFESVHSMDGSICDMEKMCDITHKYGGIAYVDEVHAVGLYGNNGAGIGERDNVLHKMDIITGTLGKAFGNIGGYIAGSSHLCDMIRSYGSGFIFTTSLPPSVIAGSLAAIQISSSDEGRQLRLKHQLYASQVKYELKKAGLPVMDGPSHIVPVLVGNNYQAAEICNRLMNEYNIYIQSINYPTVARGTERLRIVPNPHHTPEMINDLIQSLVNVWQQVGLKLNN